jgi:hypothetical protein
MRLLFEETVPLETRRAVLRRLAQLAVDGDLRVAAFLFDRVYGRPTAAEPSEGVSDDHGLDFDLDRLNDREFNTVVRLLEKCSSRLGLDSQPPPRRRSKSAPEIPAESTGIRGGGAQGSLVGKTGRYRTRALKT